MNPRLENQAGRAPMPGQLETPGGSEDISVEVQKSVEIYISMCIGLRTPGGLKKRRPTGAPLQPI